MRNLALVSSFLILFSGCAELMQMQKKEESAQKTQTPVTQSSRNTPKSNLITPNMKIFIEVNF